MQENKFYNDITNIIESYEINYKTRIIENHTDKLKSYWQIGKIIIEAQGGEKRAKYGDNLIKKWSIKFTKLYGKNYSSRELRKMRQFYLIFPKWCSVSTISWTHYRYLLTIKNSNASYIK